VHKFFSPTVFSFPFGRDEWRSICSPGSRTSKTEKTVSGTLRNGSKMVHQCASLDELKEQLNEAGDKLVKM
jgi:hypothetical protein